MNKKIKTIQGFYNKHTWLTNSACRHLLYESCDLDGTLGVVGQAYQTHLHQRKFHNFRNDNHRKEAEKILLELYDYLSDEIDIFPIFGTLLGIVREKSLIPHDDDIDFGFFKKDQYKMISKLDRLHGNNGFLLIRNEFSNLYSLVKKGVMIDLYEYERIEVAKLFQQGHRTIYNLLFDEVLPLKTIEFKGKIMKCIKDPIMFLERYYGKDWKTPK